MNIHTKYNEILKECSDIECDIMQSKNDGNHAFVRANLVALGALAVEWRGRVISLRNVLASKGYGTALRDLDEYIDKFRAFETYTWETQGWLEQQ